MSKARKKVEKQEFMNHVTWEALCGREELSREPSVSKLFLRCHQNKKTKVFVDATAKAAWEGYNAVHGADNALDAQSGNGAKTFPKWIDRVGSKNGTAYGVGDVDEYVCQPNIEEPSAHNIPNVEIVQLVDLVKVQQVDHNLLKTEVVSNEVGKAVAEEVGRATQQILDAIRIRPV
nr:hypothetical protein [Tanacetum cinerariifolium]